MTRKVQNFKDLNVWQNSHSLCLLIYKRTQSFPKEELFVLTSQVRRATVSVTSNIAEGFSRRTLKDKRNFYIISKSSLNELESQMLIAKDLNYLSEVQFKEIEEKIIASNKMLTRLIQSVS